MGVCLSVFTIMVGKTWESLFLCDVISNLTDSERARVTFDAAICTRF